MRSRRRTVGAWQGGPRYSPSAPALPLPVSEEAVQARAWTGYSARERDLVLRARAAGARGTASSLLHRHYQKLDRFSPARQQLSRAVVARDAERRFDPLAVSNVLRMANPLRVLFCVRRKMRREVLFALRRAGYSGSARKRHYHRSQESKYGC